VYNLGQYADGGGYQHNVLTSVSDSLLRTTSYVFDQAMRATQVTAPEGNSVTIGYDDKSNIETKTTVPKLGSGLTAVAETAHVDTVNCASSGYPVLCYRPAYTRDAAGRQTDYVYNTLGQVTEKTEPADANGVRRKTYITYDASSGISRPSVVRLCGLGTTCSTVDEVRTEYGYWGSTLLPLTVSKVDARTGTTLTTSYSYDGAGRPVSIDGPLPGSDDAVYTRYDVLGRKVWEIGAKGANGLRAAQHYYYRDSDDKVFATETGTVAGPVDAITPSVPTMTVLTRTDIGYDVHRNPTREALSAGGTTYVLTERSFDDRGQLTCQAQRMNAAAFGAVTDGCTLGAQGSAGPDRITRNLYDAAGQLTQVQKAYLTGLQQNYATYEYTANGKQKAVTDANGNRAEMTYDGLDRQARWIFPSPTTPNLANQGDYEQYGYDAVGNRTSFRKRDGVTLTYAYDGTNKLTLKTAPASTTGAAGNSVYYGYDVNGLQLYARFGSASGAGLTNVYDGFGRPTSSTNTMGGVSRTISNVYDVASRRTAVTHPDGHFPLHLRRGGGPDFGRGGRDRNAGELRV
jgi:YD repeat-containing protein